MTWNNGCDKLPSVGFRGDALSPESRRCLLQQFHASTDERCCRFSGSLSVNKTTSCSRASCRMLFLGAVRVLADCLGQTVMHGGDRERCSYKDDPDEHRPGEAPGKI